MKKSTLIMMVSIVLAIALGVGGTLAYLVDQDADVNTMTLGSVEIVQNEQQRVEANGEFSNELEPFENDKPLMPYTERVGATADTVTIGDYEVTLPDTYNNYVDKIVTVTNTGKSDAYVRTFVALPTGGTDHWRTYDAAADVWLHWNLCKDVYTYWDLEEVTGTTAADCIVIDDVEYEVWQFTYKTPLAPGKTTYPVIRGLFMDKRVGMDDDGYFMTVDGVDYPIENIADSEGKVNVLVLSQAVQVAGFADANTALEAAFPCEVANLQDWFGGIDENAIGSPGDKNDTNNPPEFDNAEHWDGTADTSWYNDTDTEFVIETAEQLAGLAKLVNGGNTFEGKTVKLGADICLGCLEGECAIDEEEGDPLTFRPIGDKNSNSVFKGTFDGDDHTIANMYQNGWDLGYEWGKYGTYGLFGIIDDATVKNLNITGAESYIEGGDVSFVAGSATGTCVFENITISDSVAATYNNGCGGIIGWSGAGNYTFKNITLEESAVLAGLWGSFDSSIGGIVGQGEPGATYNFENVDIKCRIDAYNDCTASYDYYNYRMCGMIIGRLEQTTTIDGTNYPDTSKYNITCNNVNVTYGDWANYHYCDPTPSNMNNGRGMRVEAGYSYDGIPADFDHSTCTSHCQELIPFDQVFGGDQYGVKGLANYEGVTVVYNNK